MPSHRNPKGVYNRNSLDWFIDRAASVEAFADGLITINQLSCGVYNNATDGSVLLVYGLQATGKQTDSYVIQMQQGAPDTPGGTLQMLNPLAPMIAGQAIASLTSPDFNGGPYIANFVSNGVTWSWPHPFPIAKVPPGYSVYVSSPSFTSDNLTTTWQIVNIKDP